MSTPYEQPTDELRQVVSRFGQLVSIQRKWRIYKPEYEGGYLRVWTQSPGPGDTHTVEWRDLPVVAVELAHPETAATT